MRVEQVVVGDVRVLAEHEQGRDARRASNGGGGAGHLAVGGDHRRLAVAVAPAAVLVLRRGSPRRSSTTRPSRCALQDALDEAPVDALLERGVRPVARGRPPPRAARSRGRSGSRGRGARAARRARVGGRRPRTRAGRRTSGRSRPRARRRPLEQQRVDVLVDAPGRLVRRRAVAEQVGREHVAAGEPALGQHGRAPPPCPVTPCRQTTRGARGSPHASTWSARLTPARRALRATPAPSRCAVLVLDERPDHDPSLSIRNVPRRGAPVSSLKTP